jgi:hypothetical protein
MLVFLIFRQEQQFLQKNEKKLGELQNLQGQIHELFQEKGMQEKVMAGVTQPEGWREGGMEGERLQQGWTEQSPCELYRKEMSGGILLSE